MKLALILNAIDPLIGGVLIMGHRGTGKSTAVRALADLLPEIEVVEGCPYNCEPHVPECADCRTRTPSDPKMIVKRERTPVVELPLGATEDRVCGTISIERALQEGVKTFEPGLLAKANRGFFYIDEVNLLEDHLVDLLLDVAATGWNRVEREGISVEHPAHFVLIGSGNPEEGELRPQLVDRFGLSVQVTTENDLQARVEVIERRDRYDREPDAFRRSFAKNQSNLQRSIMAARESFTSVAISNSLLTKIAQLCIDLKIDGHRGELTIMRAARAVAAFEGRSNVNDGDVRRVAIMALRHRTRRNPLEETAPDDRIERAIEASLPSNAHHDDSRDYVGDAAEFDPEGDSESVNSTMSNGHAPGALNTQPSPNPAHTAGRLTVDTESSSRKNRERVKSGKHSAAKRKIMNADRGRHSRSVSLRPKHAQVALAATLRTMLVHDDQASAGDNLRYKVYSRKKGRLFIFAIDASGSMGQNRIAVAKRVMLDRLQRSYVNRDAVAIVCFRGESAGVPLPPTRSILRARRVLDSLRVGGGTPLSLGLAAILDLIRSVGQKHGDITLLLFTDGRGNVSLRPTTSESRSSVIASELTQVAIGIKQTGVTTVVVDTKLEFESSDDTRRLAELLNGQWIRILGSRFL